MSLNFLRRLAGSKKRVRPVSRQASFSIERLEERCVLSGTPVFINELHYDNTGGDAGEAVEIAGPAGTDLTGWSVAFYNGNGGAVYATLNLSGTIDDEGSGFGALGFTQSGIQNGGPDGLALVDDSGTVIQFLSYEGSFTATDGPANTLTSVDIGVSEAGNEAVGLSLQLIGDGSCYEDFTWTGPVDDSFGSINTGQTFSIPLAAEPGGPIINEFSHSTTGTDVEFLEIFADPNTDLSNLTIISIDGSGGTIGGILDASAVGTTDANGIFAISLPSNTLQNDSITFLLVDGFSGSVGDDLDTDDDGVLDSTPWTSSLDDVAVDAGNSGDQVYSTIVLDANFDGNGTFEPGGASRINDGIDTDQASDWIRNEFDLDGSPAASEFVNSAGALNNPLFLNEFVANHTGTDDAEFVEVIGLADRDYSDLNDQSPGASYSVLVIEGDSGTSGNITEVIDLGATNADGIFSSGFLNNAFQNGTQTFLLVRDFTGSVGDDTDADDDGVFDNTPWYATIDSVAVSDDGAGDLVYSPVVLDTTFSGGGFPPGGASRIGNATAPATDASAWVRNNFDVSPEFDFTQLPLAPNTAVNSPGELNFEGPLPEVDLNGTGDTGTGFDSTFTAGGGAVTIVDTDLEITTPTTGNLIGAVAEITDLADGTDEVLSVDTTGTFITAFYDDANGILTLTGEDTVANYQTVLRTLQYDNANPTGTSRAVDVFLFANDGGIVSQEGATGPASVANITIDIGTGTGNPPVITAGGPYTVEEGSSVTLAATVADPVLGSMFLLQVFVNNGDGTVETTNTAANTAITFMGTFADVQTELASLTYNTGAGDLDGSGFDPIDLQVVVVDVLNSEADVENISIDIIPGTTVSISGVVFTDTNEDGDQDSGELGINEVTVTLYEDVNMDGALDDGDVIVASVDTTNGGTTPEDGFYEFTDLDTALNYLVVVDRLDTPVFGRALTTPGVIAVSGATATDQDFGFETDRQTDLVADDPFNPGETALFISGTDAGERIVVQQRADSTFRVFVQGSLSDEFNGITGNVYVNAFGSNDVIDASRVYDSFSTVVLFGGDGNDFVIGGNGDDLIFGEAGSDRLFGGYAGNDIIIGGTGSDQISGYYRTNRSRSFDSDLLVGDSLAEGDFNALRTILDEWTNVQSATDIDTRITAIETALGATLGSLISDDGESDRAVGGTGEDLFLGFGGNDVIADFRTNDRQ